MSCFIKVILFTDSDGRAKFREEPIDLSEGTPQAMLSPVLPRPAASCAKAPSAFAAGSIAPQSRSGCSYSVAR